MKLVGNKEDGYQLVSSFAAPAKPTKNAGKDKNKDTDKSKGAGKDKGNTPEPPAPDDENGVNAPDTENGNAVAPDTEKENEKGKDNK